MCDNKMEGDTKMASITTYNSLYNHNKLIETQDYIAKGYEQVLEPSSYTKVWKKKQIDSKGE